MKKNKKVKKVIDYIYNKFSDSKFEIKMKESKKWDTIKIIIDSKEKIDISRYVPLKDEIGIRFIFELDFYSWRKYPIIEGKLYLVRGKDETYVEKYISDLSIHFINKCKEEIDYVYEILNDEEEIDEIIKKNISNIVEKKIDKIFEEEIRLKLRWDGCIDVGYDILIHMINDKEAIEILKRLSQKIKEIKMLEEL